MRGYIFVVDMVNRRVGRVIMYGMFVMMGILLWSSLSKTFFNPSLWTLEMAQFAMVAYYILGGPYAVQTDANVRMDLFYGSWSVRRKAWFDSFTVMFMLFYLAVLLWGGIDFHDLQFSVRGRTKPKRLAALPLADQGHHGHRYRIDDFSSGLRVLQGHPAASGRGILMSYELITILMFALMMLMLATGQRVFAAIGFVAVLSALLLWGDRGGYDLGFAAAMKLMKWYPLLTLPMFIFMGYVLSESKIADDLYRMFHVWTGGMAGGLAMGTIGLMVLVSAMNGLSVAGMAIGATIALPELLKRNYDKRMVTGVIQAGSSLGILVPPSVVLVLYAMIARQPVGQLWLAGIFPGLMMAALFVVYIWLRCWITPSLGPVLPEAERDVGRREKFRLLRAGLLPLFIYAVMIVPFVSGSTSLVESSAIGALAAFLAAVVRRRMTRVVLENSVRNTLRISCMFMWIILAALAFGSVFDGLGAAHAIEDVFTEQMGLSPWMMLVLMQLSFLVMGTFLDDTAMLVIVAPLYVPLVDALGFDLIWYGVLYTITTQIAYMTPPFGYNLFLMRAMAPPEITLRDIYRSIIPFVGVMIVALMIIMIFPEIALWFPGYVYGK